MRFGKLITFAIWASVFDGTMSNVAHINRLTSVSHLMLRNIRSVRYQLDVQTAKTLVQYPDWITAIHCFWAHLNYMSLKCSA